MKKKISMLLLVVILSGMILNIIAIQRFPKPEFEKGYKIPTTQLPASRSMILEYLDVIVLISSLSVITWLVHKKRSRKGVLIMTIFSIAYFGFYRKGCVCSVGSLQNITAGLFHSDYQVPITVIAFFILPLLFTLFYGRTFCAGVCPLGAIQDIVAIRPMQLNKWVQTSLGVIPFIYLGLSVLYAATGTDFIICRYDPFIGIFRLNAPFMMFAIGGALLLAGVFIARPYCRFLCPYGILLNLVSRISYKHLTVTPSKCIECRLCENSCPYGAIDKPIYGTTNENRNTVINRVIKFVLLTPALVILCGFIGSVFHENLSMVNPKVRLAYILSTADAKTSDNYSIEISAFKGSGKTLDQLYIEAKSITRQFYFGGWILGGFLGLILGLTLAKQSFPQNSREYRPNKGTCLSCTRCVDFCPVKN